MKESERVIDCVFLSLSLSRSRRRSEHESEGDSERRVHTNSERRRGELRSCAAPLLLLSLRLSLHGLSFFGEAYMTGVR